MCGIAGILGSCEGVSNRSIVAAMMRRIRHRGPDSSGVWADDSANVAFGHRRLAVIDLSPAGHQPMVSASGRTVLVFNGEIYNFAELRRELVAAGVALRGNSDTEVLLEGVELWGLSKTLSRSRGMFAIAVWDRETRRLSLARDRIGEKPLYVAKADRSLVFASELSAIALHPRFERRIDTAALQAFLGRGYVPGPRTIYENAYKIVPGSLINLDLKKLCDVNLGSTVRDARRYWSLADVVEVTRDEFRQVTPESAAEELNTTLRAAVREQMVADVPVGAFLSGGIDSSLITALMQAESDAPVRTFTIGFREREYDESGHAEAVARHLHTDHKVLVVTAHDAMSVIPELSRIYDEPFADVSQIPTLLVSRLARQHVTVSLSGDGGDELFGGYNRHFFAPQIWNRMRRWPRALRVVASKLIRIPGPAVWGLLFDALRTSGVPAADQSLPVDKLFKLADVLGASGPTDIYDRLTSQRVANELIDGRLPLASLTEDRLIHDLAGLDYASWMMFADTLTYLPDDVLVKVDRAAMSTSLETRVPLLDPRVIQAAWRLPVGFKIRHGSGKWLLRRVLERYVPPHLTERPKSGFSVPLEEWLRSSLRDWAESLLPDGSTSSPLLNARAVRHLWREHVTRRRNWHSVLWSVLMFQAWMRDQKGVAVELDDAA